METEAPGGTGTFAQRSPSVRTAGEKEEIVDALTLTHQLERTIVIDAPPATVFRYFTDSGKWAAWWGEGSTIDARPGGRLFVRYPNGVEAAGEVLDLAPPSRIAFTYGYAKGSPAPGESRVTITLEPTPDFQQAPTLNQWKVQYDCAAAE